MKSASFFHIFCSLKPQRISASYEHAYENAEIRQKCRFLRGLYITQSWLLSKMLKRDDFYDTFFSLNPWRKVSASYAHAYENAEIRQKCRFLRGLYFSPIMRSAENVEKCRCFMPHLFSLKPQRISPSYEHAYEIAEIRQKCWSSVYGLESVRTLWEHKRFESINVLRA